MDADLAGSVLIGRYRLGQRLARGGMADVYGATDLRLGRPVAVKIPHPHFAADQDFRERLRREAQSIAALDHPNVVQFYDQGEDGDRPFLVMELVDGENLGDLLKRKGVLSVERAVAIAEDILAALTHAHARGVIHRDVKPQNVLIGRNGRAKLADFGIAQAVAAATITTGGDVLGTAHYLAPERLMGAPATPASDIYGVGVVLYQMVTGRLPFDGDLPAAILAQQAHCDPTPPSTVRPDVPQWLGRLVLRGLKKDPRDRFASAAAMLAALAQRGDAPHEAPTAAFRAASGLTALWSGWRSRVGGATPDFAFLRQRGGLAIAAATLAIFGFLAARAVPPEGVGAEPLMTDTPTISATTPPAAIATLLATATATVTATPTSTATATPTATPAPPPVVQPAPAAPNPPASGPKPGRGKGQKGKGDR